MGVFVHYCDQCGIRIEPEDIEEGKAVLSKDKVYCPKCAEKLKIAPAPAREASRPARVRKTSTRMVRAKRKSTTVVRRGSRRRKRVDEYGQEAREPEHPARKKSALPLVLGICGAVVVVIVIVVAVGGSGNHAAGPRSGAAEEPAPVPEYPGGHEPEPRGEEPQPREEPPPSSAAQRRYEEVIEYGRNNPDDYIGVIDALELIGREETVSFALSGRIRNAISTWMDRWETASKKMWEKTARAADTLIAEGDYETATGLWDGFPEKYKFGTLGEECKAEASRLRKLKEAIDALKGIEGDIKAAEKKFTIEEIEEAENLLEKLREIQMRYEDVALVAEKLDPAVKKLEEETDRLAQEKLARDIEEERKKREEEEKRAEAERKKRMEERWAAFKALWPGLHTQYDQSAAQSLPLGNYTIYDGSSSKGWLLMTGQSQGVTWQFTGGNIAGRNNSASGSVLAPHYKQAYFWENYTFKLKIRVLSGSCNIAVRSNINQQRSISGTTFQVPATGQWVAVKIEVSGDAATLYLDDKQSGGLNTNYPAGYPAIFLRPNSQVEAKDITIDLKSIKK